YGLGAPAPESSYLNQEKILEVAAQSGADAVHPGYGFLAENASFAEAVQEAGLTWIGPPASAIRLMGNKSAARHLADKHDIPTVLGYDDADQSDEAFEAAAEKIGFPILVKAAAGGGGRGMRRVDEAGDFVEALASARREAEAAFGDGTLLLERYVTDPRHIEVQIMIDSHGHGIHLFERECSIQRRHQKIIEEAPSPVLTHAARERMGKSALTIAKAAGYVGAGTVEFLYVDEDNWFFLEMNTRLQVEHPVTEAIVGLDLVELQISIANGEALDFDQYDITISGHAIEARIYAEDPIRDYLPAHGLLQRFDLPKSKGMRIDRGFCSGDEVGIHYDPMLAKVIAWGPNRSVATQRIRRCLNQAWAPGVVTNLPLLRDIFGHPAWMAGELDTGFLTKAGLPVAPPLNLKEGCLGALAFQFITTTQSAPYSPHTPVGWRVEGTASHTDKWRSGDQLVEATWSNKGDGSIAVELTIDEETTNHIVHPLEIDGDCLTLAIDGVRAKWRILRKGPPSPTLLDGDWIYVHTGTAESFVALEPRFPAPIGAEDEPGSCTAPTPGTVSAIHVAEGDAIESGQTLLTLESMKMEHAVQAPNGGTVAAIRVEVGQAVDQGELLVRIDIEE
ncbi:MAG: biotin/lipoyl-binding protein, partial [Proteobacteria bacterium]|nr:biotin/lipoyl-binding protein [Pseudomonadota bacterium]